jgi:uncharacterized protein
VTVTKLDKETDHYISDCAWEAGFSEDVVIVPIVVEKNEIEKGHLSVSASIRNILSEGVII